MIRGHTESGSQWVGFVRGELWNKLARGLPVLIDGHRLDNGVLLPALHLALPPEAIARLERGERVCLNASASCPHFCLFLRDTNAELLDATNEYFPGGLPNAPVEQVSNIEPTGEVIQ